MKAVEIVKLIKTTLTLKGSGESENDPIRILIQYWDMKGSLLFEIDTHTKEVIYYDPEELMDYEIYPKMKCKK
jgi:hypothetical protein